MVPRLGSSCVMETMREFAALAPWRSIRHSLNVVGSHDTTRIRTLVGQDSRHVDVAPGLLLFTMPGIPMMTYGGEIGMRGEFGADGRARCPGLAGHHRAGFGTCGCSRSIGDSSQRVTSVMLCGTAL